LAINARTIFTRQKKSQTQGKRGLTASAGTKTETYVLSPQLAKREEKLTNNRCQEGSSRWSTRLAFQCHHNKI